MGVCDIIFRAKRIDDGEWIEGFLFSTNEHTYIAYPNQFDDDLFLSPKEIFIEVDHETVCQYTGYKDDTGKKIFEGDIVGFEDMTSTESGYYEMGCCGKVCYDEEEACFHVTDRLSAESWEVLGECHIIGNIFDNPELIGEQP